MLDDTQLCDGCGQCSDFDVEWADVGQNAYD